MLSHAKSFFVTVLHVFSQIQTPGQCVVEGVVEAVGVVCGVVVSGVVVGLVVGQWSIRSQYPNEDFR